MGDSPTVDRLRSIVTPIVADLGLDLYDIEQRGGTLRVTVDTQPGSERGTDLDELALVTRSVSRELDHVDPIPGRYTLEVTSPGVERALRTPERFARAVDALGPRLGPALADFVAHERGLTDVERSRGWPVRSGKMLLREALERLAAHYGGARR